MLACIPCILLVKKINIFHLKLCPLKYCSKIVNKNKLQKKKKKKKHKFTLKHVTKQPTFSLPVPRSFPAVFTPGVALVPERVHVRDAVLVAMAGCHDHLLVATHVAVAAVVGGAVGAHVAVQRVLFASWGVLCVRTGTKNIW